MRIGVDGRGLLGGRGIARATTRLLVEIRRARPEAEVRVLLAGDAAPAPLPPGVVVRHVRGHRRLLFARAAVTGRPRLDDLLGGDLDVLWLPAPAPVAVGDRVPLVLTVHDLSFATRPADYTAYERLWHRAARLERLAARADVVTCDSAATAAQLARVWPRVAQRRVRVVPLGADRGLGDAPTSPAPGLPRRFLLAVGALEPRKGTDVLLRAYAQARADGLDADLVLVGDGRLRPDPVPPGVHVLGRLDDAALAGWYAAALALVVASRDEGFGLPPLEAAAYGTPSLVSDLPVFGETLGADGALRSPPGDPGALAAAMVRIGADPALRERIAAAAGAAATRLTWAASAAGLLAAFDEAAGR